VIGVERASNRSSPSSTARTRQAAALSRGLFPLPHRGDWMHAGHPSSHGHATMSSFVRASSPSSSRNARSASPAPPGTPSYRKIAGPPTCGWCVYEIPPTSPRSAIASSGNRPIAACSAAWIPPMKWSPSAANRSGNTSGTAIQSPVVSYVRGGTSSGWVETGSPSKSLFFWYSRIRTVTSSRPKPTGIAPSVRSSRRSRIFVSFSPRTTV